ncbi:PX domain-containing protein ypt35 [Aspergillus viridinutans]|uniref:Endosomal/vacuolar adapter protein YPT35 n=1 Tax=Aspergillus viridinutans TaxID=75553 RepID=A0A9P3F6B3_ASPVI|nr:PX domain-containing protein ypt35 [Aspergillus viridinutans]GIK07392.1 PX domain-containing protein ypt35 [Aspergillus viridinutans]
MEPANEETGSVPRPQPLSSPPQFSTTTSSPAVNTDTIVSAALSDGVSVSNGSVLPQARHASSSDRPVSGVIPPYWSHHRNASRTSQISLDQPAITLEDHSEDPNSETSRGLWAKSVTVDDYAVVKGKTGVGAYVVWNCRIQTLDGGPITVRMRYSEFDELRQQLQASFPHAKNALPALPPKSVLYKFRPAFLESRRVGLEYFLNCVLLNPEFSGSPIVKEFLFGRMC